MESRNKLSAVTSAMKCVPKGNLDVQFPSSYYQRPPSDAEKLSATNSHLHLMSGHLNSLNRKCPALLVVSRLSKLCVSIVHFGFVYRRMPPEHLGLGRCMQSSRWQFLVCACVLHNNICTRIMCQHLTLHLARMRATHIFMSLRQTCA